MNGSWAAYGSRVKLDVIELNTNCGQTQVKGNAAHGICSGCCEGFTDSDVVSR